MSFSCEDLPAGQTLQSEEKNKMQLLLVLYNIKSFQSTQDPEYNKAGDWLFKTL